MESGWSFHDEKLKDFHCSQYFSGDQIHMKVKHVARKKYKLVECTFLKVFKAVIKITLKHIHTQNPIYIYIYIYIYTYT